MPVRHTLFQARPTHPKRRTLPLITKRVRWDYTVRKHSRTKNVSNCHIFFYALCQYLDPSLHGINTRMGKVEPYFVRTFPLGIELFPRYEHHSLFQRLLYQFSRVDTGKFSVDEHAAFGFLEDKIRQMFVEQFRKDLHFIGVMFAKFFQMSGVLIGVEPIVMEDVLHEAAGVQIHRFLVDEKRVEEILGGTNPSDSQCGGQGLGDAAKMIALFRDHGTDGGLWALEVEITVRGIFDQEGIVFLDVCGDGFPFFQTVGSSSGILVVGDEIGQLCLCETPSEGISLDTIMFECYRIGVEMIECEDPHGTEIGGGFNRDGLIAEVPGEKIECLLGAGGDEDVVRVSVETLLGVHGRYLLTQGQDAG